jgi:hypothetical protein
VGRVPGFIQATLGVSEDNIAEDYALSSALLDASPMPEFERLFGGLDIPRDEIVRAMVTQPQTMYDLLKRIRSVYGDVHGLLGVLGVSGDSIVRLRAAACW